MRRSTVAWAAIGLLGLVALLAAASVTADPADINNPPTSDWIFDSGNTVTITGKTWDMNYNITVTGFSHLVFNNCDFVWSDPADINPRWIQVQWDGVLTLNNCDFTSRGAAGYYMVLYNTTNFLYTDITGLMAPNPSWGGISAFRTTVNFVNSTVYDVTGMQALYFEDCSVDARGLSVLRCGEYETNWYPAARFDNTYDSWDKLTVFSFVDCLFQDNKAVSLYFRFYYYKPTVKLEFIRTQIVGSGASGMEVSWERCDNNTIDVSLFECNISDNRYLGFSFNMYRAYYGNHNGRLNVDIQDSTFMGNGDGGVYLYEYYSNVDIDLNMVRTEFLSNGIYEWSMGGMYIYHYRMNGMWNGNITDCTFEDNKADGLRLYFRSSSVDENALNIKGTNFDSSPEYGVLLNFYYYPYQYYPDISFDHCDFTNNGEAAVFVQHDWMNGYGYSLSFTNCDFTGADGGGVLSDSYGDGSADVMWSFEDCTLMNLGDEAIMMYLDEVQGGASLDIMGCEIDHTGGVRFKVDGSSSSVQAMHSVSVVGTDIMNTDGAAFDAALVGYYGLGLDAVFQDINVTNATFEGLKATTSTDYASATQTVELVFTVLRVDVSDVSLGSGLNLGTDRVDYGGTRTIDVDSLTIDGCLKAMVLSGLKGEFVNTAIHNSVKQDIQIIATNIELYEIDLDGLTEETVQVIESGSAKFWYNLKIYVNWDTGGFVEDAVVQVLDNHRTLIGVFTQETDDGLPEILLNSYQFRETGLFSRSPYVLEVSFKKIKKTDAVALDANKEVTVTLADHMPPNVFINEPASGHIQQSTTINVRGSSYDGESGVDMVEVSLDGDNWFQTSDVTSWQHTFSVTQPEVVAAGGMFTIRARASDVAGNNATTIATLRIDPFPPELRVDFPYNGYQTNMAELEVRGVTEPGASVLVNGIEVPVGGSLFSSFVDLVEGPNTITVSSSDVLGNVKTIKMEVVLDTKPPYIVLLNPEDGGMFIDPSIDVSGQAEDGLTIVVDGYTLGSNQYNNETFSYAMSLNRGENTITVTATDMAGNHITIERTVTLDDVPPLLAVSSPADGVSQSDASIMVVGTTNPDSTLLINDEQVTLDHGLFTHEMVGVEGENLITIVAMDEAGNIVQVTRTVNVDTMSPTLTITSPATARKTVTVAEFELAGTTEGADELWVNNVMYSIALDGTFSVPVTLLEGVNRFIVEVQDEAGNSVVMERIVTLDTVSPILVVRIPGSETKDGLTTYRTEKGPAALMRVTGYTDDAVQVFVNGELVAISDEGYFEYEMPLAVKTTNSVDVMAKDAAGNEVTWSDSVSHKYIPPEEEEGFEWGWLILIIGLIILVICIAIGYRMVTSEQPEVEMPEVYEEEVLAPAELPEVEEEEDLEEEPEEEDEGVEIEVEVEEEEEEEVHEITAPSERPRTSASRREASTMEAPKPELEDKDLEDRDADADIGADETDQEGI